MKFDKKFLGLFDWIVDSKLTRDILRDKGSDKYSITKALALGTFLMFGAYCTGAFWIMMKKSEVDHILLAELITMILTLVGLKTFKPKDGTADPKSE